MAIKRRKRRTARKTRKTKRKADGKWQVPKGFVIISKDAARSLMKSATALNTAIMHMQNAETLNNRALSRALR